MIKVYVGLYQMRKNKYNEWYPGRLQISLHIDLPDF